MESRPNIRSVDRSTHSDSYYNRSGRWVRYGPRSRHGGRWGVIAGLLITQGGFFFERSFVAWGGVVVAVAALLINTAGKFATYWRLETERTRRLSVMDAWLGFVAVLGGLLVDYTHARGTPGYEGNFWALVIAAVGFATVYWGLRTRYVPVDATVEE